MTCTRLPLVLLLGLAVVRPLSADQRPATSEGPNSQRGSGARLQMTVPSSQARITGMVVTLHEPPRPVPKARVRLRTTLGKIVETVKTGEKGEFAFTLNEGGSFYVELVDDKGRVLAVEDVGETTVSVTLGQVSTTILRVPISLTEGAWGNAAKTILGAAATSGVAGVAGTGQPASPEQ